MEKNIQRIGIGKSRFPSVNETEITTPEFDFTFDSTQVTFDSDRDTFDFDWLIEGPGDYSKKDYNKNDYKTELL
jgi:hypothetical protein